MNTEDTLAAYRELGRLQGKEMVRKIYEETLLKHVAQVRAGNPKDLFSTGYLEGLEYAIRVLEIKL